MSGEAARRVGLGATLATLLLASGCGGSEPEPLEAMEPIAPNNLCSLLPETATAGLQTSSSVDETGNPTAACSVRSAEGAGTVVSGVVTWVQLNDELSADRVFKSQCDAIDLREFREQAGFQADGAEEACAARGKTADAATLAAVTDLEVITVRLTSEPGGATPALSRSQSMLEGVLGSLSG